MSTPDPIAEEALAVAQLDQALTHPDPDWADLPEAPPGWLPATQRAAEHLCRAILAAPKVVEDLKRRAREDALAWAQDIRVAEERLKKDETILRDYILKHGEPLKTPWFTATVQKHQDRIVVNNPGAAIEVCKKNGWDDAVRYPDPVVAKKEFDVYFNSDPDAFAATRGDDGKPIAEAVPREPSLVIRPKKYGKPTAEEPRPQEVG